MPSVEEAERVYRASVCTECTHRVKKKLTCCGKRWHCDVIDKRIRTIVQIIGQTCPEDKWQYDKQSN